MKTENFSGFRKMNKKWNSKTENFSVSKIFEISFLRLYEESEIWRLDIWKVFDFGKFNEQCVNEKIKDWNRRNYLNDFINFSWKSFCCLMTLFWNCCCCCIKYFIRFILLSLVLLFWIFNIDLMRKRVLRTKAALSPAPTLPTVKTIFFFEPKNC